VGWVGSVRWVGWVRWVRWVEVGRVVGGKE
jgi:hypothetical protein